MAQPAPVAVKRIAVPTRSEFMRQWFPLDEPILISNAVNGWRARELWNAEFFARELGGTKVWVEKGPLVAFERENVTVAEFVRRAIDPPEPEDLYWSEARIFDLFPGLAEHIDLDNPDLFDKGLMGKPRMYFGPARAFTPLHFDYAPSFTAQLAGRKRWVFYSRRESAFLYRYPLDFFLGHFSKINRRDLLEDFRKFPLFERAHPCEAVIEPGDILYVPEGWWHHVTALETSISLELSWKTWKQFAIGLAEYPIYKLLGKRQAFHVKLNPKRLDIVRHVSGLLRSEGSFLDRETIELGRRAEKLTTRMREVGERKMRERWHSEEDRHAA